MDNAATSMQVAPGRPDSRSPRGKSTPSRETKDLETGMTRKQRRATMIGLGVALLSVAAILVAIALKGSIVFFYTPSDVISKNLLPGQRVRIGGLVTQGSVKKGNGAQVEFSVTDTIHTIKVRYEGFLPDLFAEGQGVVTEGTLDEDGGLMADTVLAKHDENYMPPEVAAALKAKGVKLGKGASHAPDK